MEINTSKLVKRLENYKKNIEKTIANVVEETALEMESSITNHTAFAWSPSWQQAITALGVPYFFAQYPGGREDGRNIGLLEAIEKSRLSLVKENGHISAGIGDINTLDALAPYWRIFFGYGEFKRPIGVRAGGSDTHEFIPSGPNIGTMVKSSSSFHPGVLPVFIFDETIQHYKPIFEKRIKKAIKNIRS